MKYVLKSKDIIGFPKNYTKDACKNLLSGKLFVDAGFDEHMDYDIDSLDWNVNYSKAPTTHQLYLQSLMPVIYLAGGYIEEHKKKYLALANKFINSWYEFSLSAESEHNEYIWDEHATALRAESILSFLLVCRENRYKVNFEFLEKILIDHATWLSNIDNYQAGTNHGVFENRALMYLGFAFDNKEYINISKERTLSEVKHLFTSEAITTENSFTYQRINKDLFLDIALVLQSKEDDMGKKLMQLIYDAEDFMGYTIKPDGFSSSFGDTIMSSFIGNKYLNEDSVFALACSGGEKGSVEPDKLKFYPKSGYFIGREFWNNKGHGELKYSDATWLLFKSGFNNITHKHGDDNSFELYSRGYDIFVDCGMYNYMYRNPIRNYVRKSNAHNTVVVDDQSYNFLRTDLMHRCGMIYNEENNGAGYVVGFNYMYHGVYMIRHLIYFKTTIFILDEIKSKQPHKYSQLFHLGKDLKILNLSYDKMCAKIGDTNYYVSINQHNKQNIHSELFNGEMNEITDDVNCIQYGIMSQQFNEYDNINTLIFNSYKDNYQFITEINIDNKKDVVNNVDYDAKKRVAKIIKDDINIEFQLKTEEQLKGKLANKLLLDNFHIDISNNILTIKDMEQYKEDYKYAWYVFDETTRTYILKHMYDESSSSLLLDLSTIEAKCFSVSVFIFNENNGDKCSQKIGRFIRNDNNKWQYERNYETDEPLFEKNKQLYIKEILVQQKGKIFNLEVVGNNIEQVAWYIFKDGEKIDEIWYENNLTYSYKATEKGKYYFKAFAVHGDKKIVKASSYFEVK